VLVVRLGRFSFASDEARPVRFCWWRGSASSVLGVLWFMSIVVLICGLEVYEKVVVMFLMFIIFFVNFCGLIQNFGERKRECVY